MIETKSETTITCDKCGKQIAPGERWFQVGQQVTCSTFDGTASNLTPVSETSMQLCEADYNGATASLAQIAPDAAVSLAPSPAAL